jgi:FAD/FMN-containing dehydrogenase/Fe-S oxidoreductase
MSDYDLSPEENPGDTGADGDGSPASVADGSGPVLPTQDSAPEGPAADSRAGYDHTGGGVDRPGLVADLEQVVDGDVRFDEFTRELYATDASAYEVTPVGVVFPRSTDDVAGVVEYCALRDIPVLPRGGGTSLAGQAVNEAVVLDFTRHMDRVLAVDPDARTARAQPGVLLGALNTAVGECGLKFAPDPAWGDKSALGGAIGNNSTGAHSLQYAKTDAYIESCEVVLADGTVTRLGDLSLAGVRERAEGTGIEAAVCEAVLGVLDERETVENAFPRLKRNVSGYNLDRLVMEAESGRVNLARLLAGSEGTLAIVTEATVSLEPVPETKSVALLRYEMLADAMADVEPTLAHDPAAVEVLDDVLLDLARETGEFGDLVDRLAPEGTGAALLVEFYADDDEAGRQRVRDLLADRAGGTDEGDLSGKRSARQTDEPRRAVGSHEAHEAATRANVWKLRKSGLPILLSRTTDEKHISFVEDVAVDPAQLPAFVADFQAVLEENNTFASFYGHAGPGCLHVRPLVNTKAVAGTERMQAIADAVAELATEYGGAISGEHGNGRARTAYNRQLYGQRVWELFRELKRAFDPAWLLNPGQVCGYAPDEHRPDGVPPRAETVALTENLRFSPDYESELGFEPQLHWENKNGMQGMVELCHGCGGCRGPQETTGGVMCPTYRASQEEITSTRGRANALRRAMSGDLPADPTGEEFAGEVMDLCIGCKGCARNCPSEVDMAKLKAELQYQRHKAGETTLRDRLFAEIDRVSAVGSALAPLPRLLQRLPGSGLVTEKLLGIARERDLPTFRRETLVDWLSEREAGVSRSEAAREVRLFPDTFTNYSNPEVGRAAVRVLEAAGVHVELAEEVTASGRAAFSMGFLDVARERAATNVEALSTHVAQGRDIVVVEPSDAVMLQSDYLDLLSGANAEQVASATYGVCEFLDRHGLDRTAGFEGDERLVYHGHCHQKATARDHHAVGVLRRAGYTVEPLASGCCGMAGSFGYEAEHYSMSRAIAGILDRQVEGATGTVVAPGASCRAQIDDLVTDERPPHPVEMLDAARTDD